MPKRCSPCSMPRRGSGAALGGSGTHGAAHEDPWGAHEDPQSSPQGPSEQPMGTHRDHGEPMGGGVPQPLTQAPPQKVPKAVGVELQGHVHHPAGAVGHLLCSSPATWAPLKAGWQPALCTGTDAGAITAQRVMPPPCLGRGGVLMGMEAGGQDALAVPG